MSSPRDADPKTHAQFPGPALIAHRGGGKLAPENTAMAIELGASMGWLGVEFDAALAKDGVPVLMHDETLWRTCRALGRVDDFDSEELGAMDAGSWMDKKFAKARVPTLAQALDLCERLGVWPNVEIKPALGRELATGERVALDCLAHPLGGRPGALLLSSFSAEALGAAAKAAPSLARGLLLERGGPGSVDWRAICSELGCVSLNIHWSDATPALAKEAKRRGLALFCYTVNDPAQARGLFEMGVDSMCCDALGAMGAGHPALLRPKR